MKTQKFNITVAQSKIDWVGKKVTGAHNGTIQLKAGELSLTDGQITAGRFVVDTTSIKILDITDPATNAQFAGHLASNDFFSIEQYPEAYFEITSVQGNHVKGDLTIKGIANPVAFDVKTKLNDDTLTATGTIVIDRTKFGIKFRSGNFFQNLGDTLIYNDFDLNIVLTAKAVEVPAQA
ncbi:polyisoprenoid-binding protein YceI [Chitinophaga polysaccharea]|uniref:Polyisoprenoid-binding protein YceI n=1 Tax=Chitinophaga polysaccharea TaxID=1293035 RepID=A0A561PW13_9BACT|nr:YceI family protein [Chitinophaga polysaccharea]TWF42248.1 polyisoprenoid-binding protein YceI [Chitinophaga polysaccharea]